MWWRLKRSDFMQQRGEQNRKALKRIVDSGEVPGILAYAGSQPIGWCSVSPREVYSALKCSRVLKPVDDSPVWSVVCFFIDRRFRRKGLTLKLLEAAVEHAAKQGSGIVEGYPIEAGVRRMADAFVYTGLASTFRKAGFVEVLRRSESRPIMRYVTRK